MEYPTSDIITNFAFLVVRLPLVENMQVSDLQLGLRMMRGPGPETEISIAMPFPLPQEIYGAFANQTTKIQDMHIKVIFVFCYEMCRTK